MRGGYYTPFAIAQFIVRNIGHEGCSFLEPSCGDGIFITAINSALKKCTIDAIELDGEEAQKAEKHLNKLQSVFNCNFLDWYHDNRSKKQYDVVVGNPPFIRYQFLASGDQKKAADIFITHNMKFTKHTNAWVPFIVASIDMLKPGGKIGMVIPSEIFNVLHSGALRKLLADSCSSISIIDPEDIWFEGTLQGAVILFAEKKVKSNQSCFITISRVSGMGFCSKTLDEIFNKSVKYEITASSEKWTKYFLNPKATQIIERLVEQEQFVRFSKISQVDVGIVTGANAFFLVNQEIIDLYKLSEYVIPMFGRSEHCPGIIYDENQHIENANNGLPVFFVDFCGKKLNKGARDYIKYGESQELHLRYKCRIREPWYCVPSVFHTEIGMLKRCNDFPRLINNSFGALTTDTAYRIKVNMLADKFVASFVNVVTAISSELEGRSYGGGVLELVPSEIEKLLIPNGNLISDPPNIFEVDSLIRESRLHETMESVSKRWMTRNFVTKDEHNTLLESWDYLRMRRKREG